MFHADLSTNLCSRCSSPLTFQPLVNVNLDLDTCSPLSKREMVSFCNVASADSSTTLCSKCIGPLTFQPRVNLDLSLDTCSQPKLRGMVPLCSEDFDDYDAEITHLQSRISHVQAQKKRLINYQTQIQFLLSAFHRFPNEVLCLIFESTCTENFSQEHPWPSASPVITYFPALAISAVCTRWRAIALALPTLWSQIRLVISPDKPHSDFDSMSSSPDDEFTRTIQLYLDRSVDTPLAISVEMREWDYDCPPALELLLDYTYRWKSFSYTGEHQLLDELLGFDHSFPILETVSLNPFRAGDPERADIVYFEDAPNLRSIRTGGQISDLSPTWNHLTSLDTRLPPRSEELDLLCRYPALTALKLRSQRANYGPDITSLAKLESFTLVESSSRYSATSLLLESIFSCFTFSSLKELIIHSELAISGLIWPPNAFSAFISRSTCMLTTFFLGNVKISDLNLIAALRLLPSLVEFNINGCLLDPDGGSPISTHFISSLNGSSTSPLLPKLRSLSMKIFDTSFDDATFVSMVSSRWLTSSQAATIGIDCLRSVVLHLSPEVDEEVYEPLYQLNEMGMCVVITGW